jgi:hypothetical protein
MEVFSLVKAKSITRTVADLSYQGQNRGSGRAGSTGLNVFEAQQRIRQQVEQYPKILEGDQEGYNNVMSVTSPNQMVTIYRAAPADTINPGDWVFMGKQRADKWAVGTFSRKPKIGANGREFQVISMQVPASQVEWTGKNLEFQYKGR